MPPKNRKSIGERLLKSDSILMILAHWINNGSGDSVLCKLLEFPLLFFC